MAGGEAQKGIGPFCRVTSGIATIRAGTTACASPKQASESTVTISGVVSSAESLDSWSFLSFPRHIGSGIAGLEEAKNLAGKVLCLIQDRLSEPEFGKNLANLSRQFLVSANHGFEFEKRSQFFIGTHDETLSVVDAR